MIEALRGAQVLVTRMGPVTERVLEVALDTTAWTKPTVIVEPDAGRAAYYTRGFEEHLERLAQARSRARQQAEAEDV